MVRESKTAAALIIITSVLILFSGCTAESTTIAPAEDERVPTAAGYNSRYNPAHISSGEAWDLVSLNSDAIVLDVRSEASYEERHVSIAINVPFERVADYAEGSIPDKDRIIICYCFCDDKGGSALSASNLLNELGYTNAFYMEPDVEWTYEGTSVTETATGSYVHNIVSGLEAKEIYDSNSSAILLDVRTLSEYDEGHIEGSVLIPVAELADRLSELPDKDAVIIVFCKAGARSATAYGILFADGYTNVYDMQSVDNWPDFRG